jgi:putative nucleotidyltransferase with HDIG domain
MTEKATANLNATQPATLPPALVAALGSVAARFSPSGLFVCLVRGSGELAYHDQNAGAFFQRYVLPLLRLECAEGMMIRRRIELLDVQAAPQTIQDLPGIVVGLLPYVERRHVAGVLVLVAKSESFRSGEDVLRACSRLSLDAAWLVTQANAVNALSVDAVSRAMRLLDGMIHDQLRLSALESELNSLSGQLATTYEELSLIYQLSGGMKINRSTTDFFKQACLDVMDVMCVRGMGVSLLADGDVHHESVVYGAMELPSDALARLAGELTTVLAERKSPLLINRLSGDKNFGWLGEHAQQLLAVPLMRQDQLLGCLFGLDKSAGEFDTVDSKLLNSIANESAIYLENAMLFEDVRELMMGLLHSLTSAVDAKDAYTCGHSERVALLSRTLAQSAGLSEAEVERIYMAGLLHDVGKIGVPEAVLQKTGRLTAEEFEQIKKHPEIGARILRDVKQLEDILPGVMHHHERYDGRGYPSALAGENIPIMGRIICLADCFDAMTSSRTYRKALPLEVALTEIRRCAGTQFDPVLSDAFLKIDPAQLRELIRDHQKQAKRLLDVVQQKPRAA